MHNPAKDAPATAAVRTCRHHVRTIYTATKYASTPTGEKGVRRGRGGAEIGQRGKGIGSNLGMFSDLAVS